jgi:arylsulfatase A
MLTMIDRKDLRALSVIWGCLYLGTLCLVCFGTQTLAAEMPPNIVVVLCDDLGYGDLECYGHPYIKTPNLNSLAADGIRLTACYSAAPVCSPSRVGLLTGRSPNRAGVYDWIPPANAPRPDARDLVHMRQSEVTVAQLLQRAGYATCMSGKWHCNAKFNSSDQPQPGDAGFDHWFGTQNNAAPSHVNPINYIRNGREVGKLEGTSCQLATREAVSWLERQRADAPQQPFFIYLAFHEPHEPVASPVELVAKYESVARNADEAQFFANVENVDLAVGHLVRELERLNCRDNTLIIFTADNGPETLNRYRTANRSYGRATPLRGMKLWTTEAGFRVAGIINWPAKHLVPGVSDQPVSSLDFLPTFCQLAGMQPPSELKLDGTSFLPLLEGKTITRTKPLLWCYFNSLNEHAVAMRSGDWKMLAKLNHGQMPKLQNVFDGNRADVVAAELTDFELYRLDQDIGEARNVFDADQELSQRLKQQMEEAFRELVTSSHVWQRTD